MRDTGNDRNLALRTVPRVPARARWTVLGIVGLAFFLIGMVQASRDAPTVDEGVDLSSGISILVRHDLRMVPEHGPLPRALAAVPALLGDPIVPRTQAWDDGDWFDWSDDFIAANDRADRLQPMLRLARVVPLLEGIGCAALLYALARRPFGPDGGLLVASAWLTTPYVVGLAHTAMIDVPFTLAVLGCCVLLVRWWERPSLGRAVALGLALGAALSTRHTAVVLVLVASGVMAVRLRDDLRACARSIGLAGLTAVVAVWAVYRGLDPSGPSGGVAGGFDALSSRLGGGSVPMRLMGALPLPPEWRAGLGYLDLTSTDRPSALLGQSWDGGRWWYFPASAALKLPLPLLLAVVAGWALALRRGHARRALVASTVVPAIALWLSLVGQPLNLGLRMAMPVVALALVGLGGMVSALPASASDGAEPGRFDGRGLTHGLWAPVAIGVVVVGQIAATLAALPTSLAWTPPPWRPPYRWVSDANLDAGQSFFELRAWVDQREAWVAFDRTRGLEFSGGTKSLLEVNPSEVTGWVAVGVTPLVQTRRDELSWLRKYCPVDDLGGGAVLIYRFAARPSPSPGPERPAPPCWGATFSDRDE